MKLQSFIRTGWDLEPLEVEVTMMPGLPQIQILGLPDQAIKESIYRVKSAIRNSDFEFPSSRQIIVDLKPAQVKKASLGLDLPIAAAILWLTGQAKKPEGVPVVYGALDLDGRVLAPEDLGEVSGSDLEMPEIWTGQCEQSFLFDRFSLSTLKDLKSPVFLPRDESHHQRRFERPSLPDIGISKNILRPLAAASFSGEPVMLAGPAGTGKSTMANLVAQLRPDPTASEWTEIQKISRRMGHQTSWRPILSPHHTSTTLSLVGGGTPVYAGEITRAHGGTLILDEYLEFNRKVQDALRECMENGKIRLTRGRSALDLPAKFFLVGTTNLCRCGAFVPYRNNSCRCREILRKQYLERLSGPVLDRFTFLLFSHEWKDKSVPAREARALVDRASQFITRGVKPVFELPIPQNVSMRRRRQLIAAAQAFASLDQSELVRPEHLGEAIECCLNTFESLKAWGC